MSVSTKAYKIYAKDKHKTTNISNLLRKYNIHIYKNSNKKKNILIGSSKLQNSTFTHVTRVLTHLIGIFLVDMPFVLACEKPKHMTVGNLNEKSVKKRS